MTLIVARFRRQMALRPVNRIKHVIDTSATPAEGADTLVPLILAKDAPVITTPKQVITGSKIYGIYLKVEVAVKTVNASAISNVYMIISKNPGGNLTIPAPNNVGVDDNKKFVIHQEMVMMQNATAGNPRVLFNGVIKIPKNYQRFGPNDELNLNILAPSNAIIFCVQSHYKEFR